MVIMSNIQLPERLSGVEMTPEQSAYFLWGYICSLAQVLADQELQGRQVDKFVRASIAAEYQKIIAEEVKKGGDTYA